MKRASHAPKFLLLAVLWIFAREIRSQASADTANPIFREATFEELAKVIVVTTASKKAQRISEAPAMVYVITRRDIEDRGYWNLVDVLRDLPGMETDPHYFAEAGTLVPVRGVLGNNKIIFLLNGVRLNPPGGEYFPLHSDFSVRSAERIEIIYGPGSTLYGQDAISAVVNVITSEPEETRKAEAFLDGGLINQAGSYGHTEAGASFEKKFSFPDRGPIGVQAFVQGKFGGLDNLEEEYPGYWQTAFGPGTPAEGQSDPAQRWDDGGNAMLRVTTSHTAFQAWHRESSRSTAEGANIPIYYVKEGVWHDRADVISTNITYDFSKAWNLESTAMFSRYQISPESRYVFPIGDTLFFNDYKYTVGTGTSLEEKLGWYPRENLSVIGGLNAGNYSIVPKATIPGGAFSSQNVVRDAGFFTYYTRRGDSSSRVDVARANIIIYQVYSAYAEMQYKVIEPLSFVAGARLDANTRFSEIPVLPRLAAIYRFYSGFTAKYIFTKAYVSPAPYFSWDIFDNGLQLNTSNPGLDPEQATSNEVNLTYASRKLIAGASGYRNTNSNIILVGDSRTEFNVILDSVWTSPDPAAHKELLTHSVNLGRSDSHGLDVFGRGELGRVSLWGSYSYVEYERTLPAGLRGSRTQYALDNVSKHNFRAGATTRIGKVTATLSGFLRSTPQGISGNASLWGLSEEVVDPYEIDAFLRYAPRAGLSLFAQAYNLTNHSYALKGVTPTPSPQEKMKLVAGISLSF